MKAAAVLVALLSVPPSLQPQDDPGFEHCVRPEDDAVRLRWSPQEEPGVATWLLVKRRDDSGEWRPWVKSYVKGPPFTLAMRSPTARNGDFAWALFAVDRGAGEYVVGDWHYFCTRD
jgi:hypothetical protein